MRDYELTIIADPGLDEKDQKSLREKIKKNVEAGKGKVTKEDIWGLKRLSYPIAKKEDGFYVFYILRSEPAGLVELEKNLKLEEKIMRYLLIKRERKRAATAKDQ